VLNAFEPQEMALLIEVVDRACAALGDCDETARAMIAAQVLIYAERGERDFEVLLSSAKHSKDPVRAR